MSSIDTFEALSQALDALAPHPVSRPGPTTIARRLLELAEARGFLGVSVGARPDDSNDDAYVGRFALLGEDTFEVHTSPRLADPVARALVTLAGSEVDARRPGRIDSAQGHFRVWNHSGSQGVGVYAWRRDAAQAARMMLPSEAGFDATVSEWLEAHYVEFRDSFSRMLVVAAERIEDTRSTIDLLLGLMDNPNMNIIAAEEGGISVRAPWLNQIVCTGDLTLAQAVRAALRQDPDAVLAHGPSASGSFPLLAQAAFTGHAVLTSLAAPSAEAAIERVEALCSPVGMTPAFDVLFVRERSEDGRLRLSGELRLGD